MTADKPTEKRARDHYKAHIRVEKQPALHHLIQDQMLGPEYHANTG